MKYKLFKFFSYIYFFFNIVALPFGVQYLMFISPFLYFKMVLTKKKVLYYFFLFTFPYVFIHFVSGISDKAAYFQSYALHIIIFILVLYTYRLIKKHGIPEDVMKSLVKFNVVMVFIAIIALKTSLNQVFWKIANVSGSITNFPRLKLLTYEPSYYAILQVPLFFYFFKELIQKGFRKTNLVYLILVTGTICLSFSFGVICVIIMATFFTAVFRPKTLSKAGSGRVSLIIFLLVIGGIAILLFFSHNVFLIRIGDLLNDRDISGNARLLDPWTLTTKILKKYHDVTFGIGFGQYKILAHDLLVDFYGWQADKRATLPNEVAETYVVFGVVGLILRFTLIFVFFAKTKPYKSFFRFNLFIFIFIYEFTGGYLANYAEYIIWILAFSPIVDFKKYLKPPKKEKLVNPMELAMHDEVALGVET